MAKYFAWIGWILLLIAVVQWKSEPLFLIGGIGIGLLMQAFFVYDEENTAIQKERRTK